MKINENEKKIFLRYKFEIPRNKGDPFVTWWLSLPQIHSAYYTDARVDKSTVSAHATECTISVIVWRPIIRVLTPSSSFFSSSFFSPSEL